VFGSLNVEDCLRVAKRKGGPWTEDRVYDLFPRLKERRRVSSAQLSGGEQQMLAVGRALVTQPRLLIMDEPSEGLAPVIVDQLVAACHRLSDEGMHLIVVEQNLNAALALADEVVVIDNGRITAALASAELRDDPELQRRHLGIASAST
jgi:branched-chain amino acid transport system ATP-binding protein